MARMRRAHYARSDGQQEHAEKQRRRFVHTSRGLVELNGLKEGLEVAGAKALVVVALDQLDEERRPVLHRLGKSRTEARGGRPGSARNAKWARNAVAKWRDMTPCFQIPPW